MTGVCVLKAFLQGDGEAEAKIQATLTELMKAHNNFIILHRLSSVIQSGAIYVPVTGEILNPVTIEPYWRKNPISVFMYVRQNRIRDGG